MLPKEKLDYDLEREIFKTMLSIRKLIFSFSEKGRNKVRMKF